MKAAVIKFWEALAEAHAEEDYKKMEITMKTAGIYARRPSAIDGDASLAAQIEDCRRYAVQHGLKVVATHSDDATSGRSMDPDGLLQMVEEAKSRRFDVLIVQDLSRLSRNLDPSGSVTVRLRHQTLRIAVP